jgi:ribosomal protein S18 acetylase RimI-like enzyme
MLADDVMEERCPSVSEYIALRDRAGLSAKTVEAATRGLANTWYAVTIRRDGQCIAMGRVIGDDGCFFHIVDIAVLPEHQRRGLGSKIMEKLMTKLRATAPQTALVTLLADGGAYKLYERFGFKESAPQSIGMLLKL